MTRKLEIKRSPSRLYELQMRLASNQKILMAKVEKLLAERSKQATARVLAERLVDKLLNEG